MVNLLISLTGTFEMVLEWVMENPEIADTFKDLLTKFEELRIRASDLRQKIQEQAVEAQALVKELDTLIDNLERILNIPLPKDIM